MRMGKVHVLQTHLKTLFVLSSLTSLITVMIAKPLRSWQTNVTVGSSQFSTKKRFPCDEDNSIYLMKVRRRKKISRPILLMSQIKCIVYSRKETAIVLRFDPEKRQSLMTCWIDQNAEERSCINFWLFLEMVKLVSSRFFSREIRHEWIWYYF